MANKKKTKANKPSTDNGGNGFGFLAPAAEAGTFSSCMANTDGKQKPKK